MKYFLLLIFISVTESTRCQDIDSLTYKQANEIEFFKEISNGTTIGKYIAADGSVFRINDTLVIGKPTLSHKKTLEFIIYGKPAGFGNIMGALNGQAPTPVDLRFTNNKVLVKEMKVYHDGSKKKPLKLSIILGEVNGRAFGINKYLSVSDYELAFQNGEIHPVNQKMTRDQAIAKLKESKELMDLGLMTKEEYERIKGEMSKLIIQQ
jgi:hypothetical protein